MGARHSCSTNRRRGLSTSAPRFFYRSFLLVCSVGFATSLSVGPFLQARGDDRAGVEAMLRSVATLRERGEYNKAIGTARSALALAEKTFGRDAPQTTAVKQALGSAYLEVGNRAAAAPLLREALSSLERVEPRDMSAIGCVVGNLAQAVEDQPEAESLYRRALVIAEQVHGPDHPATALALNNIGVFYRQQGRPEEAEPPMRRALRIRERTEGMASPLAAQSLGSLGMIAADRGEMSIAETLVRGSLERRRAVLPKGHPDLAESCNQLALILLVFGKDRAEEALKLASEAFESFRVAFGPQHARTLLAMHTKGDALAALGRHAESERLHQDLIATIETLPSPHADELAESLREFGQHLIDAGKPARAIELCRRAIALRKQSPGQDDAKVIAMRGLLAEALYADAKPDQAVSEGRAILAWRQKRSETQPLDEAAARCALAKYLLAVGEMEEARALLGEAANMFEKATGRGSWQTLHAMYRLALTYVVTDELGEAERIVDDGLKRFRAADDVRTGDVAADLIGLRATIYRRTGRTKEAEKAEAAVRQAHAGATPSR